MIECTIEPILVDLLIPELKQIAKRRAPVPIFRNMQLARWRTEPRRHQHRRHLRPGNALSPDGQQPLAQIFKPKPSPQRQGQIYIAKLTRTLDADAFQPNWHRHVPAAVIKQWRPLGNANQMSCQCPCCHTALFIQCTEMRNHLLNHTPTNADAAHKAPIAMNLPILLANRVAQIHAPSEPIAPHNKIPKVVTTPRNHPRTPPTRLIRFGPVARILSKPPSTCASWAISGAGGSSLNRMPSRPRLPR